MTEQEFYRKTDECIARFKNGKERYRNSALFNRVVQMLARDADPYEIIDQLCQMSIDQTRAFEHIIQKENG
jgi:predicted kinase